MIESTDKQKEKCPMCDLIEKREKWNYEDNKFIIMDSYGSPQLIYKPHGKVPDIFDLRQMTEVIKGKFGKFRFRGYSRKIPQHIHWSDHIILEK